MRVVDVNATTRGDVTINNDANASLTMTGQSELQLEGDWSNDQVYAATATGGRLPTVIFNGSRAQAYVHLGNATDYDFQNVDFQNTLATASGNPGSITMNSDLAVTNEAAFAGVADRNVINANGNTFVMGPAATFSGAYMASNAAAVHQDYINGDVRRFYGAATSYDFPVGDANSAEPLNLNFSGDPGNVDYIDATYDAAAPVTLTAGTAQSTWLCGNPSMDGYTGTWTYDAFSNESYTDYLAGTGTPAAETTVGGGQTYAATMHPHRKNATGSGYAASGTSTTAVKAGGWGVYTSNTQNGDGDYPCINQGGAPNVLNTSSILTGFSDIGGHVSTDPLPVEFLGLTATPDDGFIYVNWQTLSETNNSHFNLFRSEDNQNFEVVKANIPGAGTTKEPQTYNYDDFQVEFNQVYYYKTQQVDYDGQSSFSNVAQAMLSRDAVGNMTSVVLYPNPTDGALNMRVTAENKQTIGMKIYDAIGKLIVDETMDVPAGMSTVDLSSKIGSVADGTYNAVVNMSNETFTTKLVITK